MKFVPGNYESVQALGLSSNEKKFLKTLKEHCNNLEAIILLKLLPINNLKLDICWIDNEMGFLPIITVNPNTTNIEQMFSVYENIILKKYVNDLENKFMNFKSLYNNGIVFPFGIIFFFENLKRNSLKISNRFIENHCLFLDDIASWNNYKDIQKKFRKALLTRPESFKSFTDAQLKNMKFAVCPEYTIPKISTEEVGQDSWGRSDKKSLLRKIAKDNFDFKTLELTDEQIDMINNIKFGHELILAGAGSGKTVLLTSRAFRVAKAFPEKDILLTCYNSPLAESVKLFLDISGMSLRNLKNKTFHGLLVELLENNGIPCFRTGDDGYFEKLFNTAVEALEQGKIENRFYGIFIDEIQDFKPEWYEFLTRLIENKKEYIINICGDKTQDIRGIIAENGEPWNIVEEIDYKDSKNILKRNFRYSKHMNNFIKAFGHASQSLLKKLDIKQYEDEELFIRSETVFDIKTEYPEILKTIKFDVEINKVIECIVDIHNKKNIPYSEIAILFPYRKNEYKKYYPYYYLLKALDEKGIPYTDFCANENGLSSYYNRRGAVVSTINKSKGLDFQAVILFGLHGLYPNKIDRNSSKENKKIFLRHVNLLYTAITRASKYLSVVILDSPNNPYLRLFDDTQLILKKVHKKKTKKRGYMK